MNILIYRYGSICEPDIIDAFSQTGLTVISETAEINSKQLSNAERVKIVEQHLKTDDLLFVFSINFYPSIAQICEIYNTLYLCWTVDSPVPELFSTAITCSTNRIFLFDYAQYSYFHKYNPEHIYYLPLASCVERFDSVIKDTSTQGKHNINCDISFIGSLYNEKNPLNKLPDLSDYSRGYIKALIDSSLKIYGYNPIPDLVTNSLICDIKSVDPDFYSLEKKVAESDSYVAAHCYIGMQASEEERIKTLNMLATKFKVDLFTRSDSSKLKNVIVHGGVETLTEMPIIFNLSKINLNITIKPIQTGLPLRIFDIMGCGGFLMTNYQEELNEYFEIGTDLEAYSSQEELAEKCSYYLSHEDERKKIAHNGYSKVSNYHRYIHRIKSMLEKIS